MKTITIPNSVISIEEGAFSGCSGAETITIPNSVTSMGDGVLKGCDALKDVKLPNDITSIGKMSFWQCINLTNITIPDSVTSIGERAFAYCSSLESIIMLSNTPPQLENSEYVGIFEECQFVTNNTKGIKVPAGCVDAYKTAWTDWADYITDNSIASGTDWTLDANGLLTIKTDAGVEDWKKNQNGRYKYVKQVKSAKILEGVTNISGVLWDALNVERVELPDNLESIGDAAFINIPSGVTSIGRRAFSYCYELTDIDIPVGATGGDWVFSDCTSLTHVTIPDGMTEIWGGMFDDCTGLTAIEIPDSVTSIGDSAFSGCSGLTEIAIPSGVTNIGETTFYGCESLTSIKIPSGVTEIGYGAFSGCTQLDSVLIQADTPPTLAGYEGETATFTDCKFVTENTKGIHVPDGKAQAYKTAWTEWADYIADDSPQISDAEKVAAAKEAVEKALEDINVSNATTKESLEKAINEAVKEALEESGIDGEGITVTVEDFAKTDATTGAAGSVTGKVTITSGTEADEVAIDTILPTAPADKVETVRAAVQDAVKKAVEQALEGTKVTNDNAQEIANQIAEEIIPAAVAKALEETGVNPADIAIGEVDIKVTLSTKDSDGSIDITIPVTSTEDPAQTGNAQIQVLIEKTGGEQEPDKDAEQAENTVKDTLGKLEITNDTTTDDIRGAIQEALGDDAVVGDIEVVEKTEATEENPGSLSLKINVTINGKTIIINIVVPIKKTGSRKTAQRISRQKITCLPEPVSTLCESEHKK